MLYYCTTQSNDPMEITHVNLYESPDCDEGGLMVTVQDIFKY